MAPAAPVGTVGTALQVQLSLRDIAWLAGLLEGEGCFKTNRLSPQIVLVMTDRDVVDRAAALLKRKVSAWSARGGGRLKVPYCVCVGGSHAVAWMMTLYPLMGARRQERIRKVITKWKTLKPRYIENTICGHVDRPYLAHGMCAQCYDKYRWRRCKAQTFLRREMEEPCLPLLLQ